MNENEYTAADEYSSYKEEVGPSQSQERLNTLQEDITTTPEEFAIRGRYGEWFGPEAQQQAQNQLAVAQTLALQKAGGGTYRGRMANAIRSALGRVQQRQVASGAPSGGFLNWYMNRYHPAANTAG